MHVMIYIYPKKAKRLEVLLITQTFTTVWESINLHKLYQHKIFIQTASTVDRAEAATIPGRPKKRLSNTKELRWIYLRKERSGPVWNESQIPASSMLGNQITVRSKRGKNTISLPCLKLGIYWAKKVKWWKT